MVKKFIYASLFMVMVSIPAACWAGMVTFTFDDGLSSVYNKAWPILKRHGQVATVGVITSKLDTNHEDFLTVAQLTALQDAGWEVASHSLTNSRPLSIPGYYDQEPVLGWAKDPDGADVFQAEYLYDQIAGLYEGDHPLKEVGSLDEVVKEPGTWYFDRPIAELHVHPLVVTDPEKLQIRAGSFEREMDQSKGALTRLGFKALTFLAPDSYWTKEIKEKCASYYPYAVTDETADNQRGSFDPHAIKRLPVRKKDSAASLIRVIQEALDRDGWVILGLHGLGDHAGPEPISTATLEQLSDWLASHNISVVTVAQGAAMMSAGKPSE